jgi:hypothetical protein
MLMEILARPPSLSCFPRDLPTPLGCQRFGASLAAFWSPPPAERDRSGVRAYVFIRQRRPVQLLSDGLLDHATGNSGEVVIAGRARTFWTGRLGRA